MDPGTGSDATHAHDFSCGVEVLELLDRVVVVGERSPIRRNQRAHPFLCLVAVRPGREQIVDRHYQRRVAVDLVRALGEDPRAVSGSRLGDVLLGSLQFLLGQSLLAHLVSDPAQNLFCVEVVVPGGEGSHAGSPPHGDPVLADAGLDDLATIGSAEGEVATQHLDACG